MSDNNLAQGIPEKPATPPVLATSNAQESAEKPRNGKQKGWTAFARRANSGGKAQRPSTSDGLTGSSKGRARGKARWYLGAGAAVVLLAGGIAVGTTLPDPTRSDEYAALKAQSESTSSDLSKLQSRYNSLNSSISGRETSVSTREAALKTAEAAVKTAESDVKRREEAVTAAEKTKAANTVKEGTWTVGTDIEPGSYRTTSEVTGSCYWEINRTGSNGADIIDNDIVTGGRPSVTLSPGQDFTTSRCGSWLKQ